MPPSPPTVAINPVTPNTRSDALDTMTIVFSEPVTGFSMFNLTLTRGGVSIPLTGGQTVTTSNNATWTLNGLKPITRQLGAYVLTVHPTPTVTAIATGLTLGTGDTESWSMVVQPWDKVTDCFRSAHIFHHAIFPTPRGSMAALSLKTTGSLTQDGTKYRVTLDVAAFPPGQDYVAGDWVEIREQTGGATNATGLWEIEDVQVNNFRLKVPTFMSNGNGGKAIRWHARRWDSLSTFTVSAAAKRGNQFSTNDPVFNSDNRKVTYTLITDIKMVSGATAGAAYLGSSVTKVRLNVPSHGYANGSVVEVAGVRQAVTFNEIGRGWWVISVFDSNNFDLEGSVWPGGLWLNPSGIVRTTSNAVFNRSALIDGGTNNAGATPITNPASAEASDRGYSQGYEDYRKYLEDHSLVKTGYYFSGSAVGTQHEVLERGINAGYPFPLTLLDNDFTNDWPIAASTNDGTGKLKLTLTRSPLAAWVGKIRVAMFGHSNPTYCLDQYLDNVGEMSGLRRLYGVNGTVTSSPNAHTIVDTTTTFPSWLIGEQLYLSKAGDPNDGKYQTIVSVSGNTLTTLLDFPAAIAVGTAYRAGALSYTIDSVSGSTMTLRTPFRGTAANAGALMLMGNLASGVSIVKGNAKPGGGFYARVTTEVAHSFALGDYLVIFGCTGSTAYNCARSASPTSSLGVRVHKVVAVGSPLATNQLEIDTAWVADASGGRWYGTSLCLLPSTDGSLGEQFDVGRCDSPDCRHPDVLTEFSAKQKQRIEDVFLAHGPRQIPFLDEIAFRFKSSAAATQVGITALDGSTTDETINRIGDLADWLRDEWCRQLTGNVSCPLTKDTFSVTQRNLLISRWGGLMSEGACSVVDRSAWQMGTDGFLDHLDAILQAGKRYYYVPQDIGTIASVPFSASGVSGGCLQITTSVDSGLLPSPTESGGSHNRAGDVIGIYGHPVASLNGVHRVRSRTGANVVTLETRGVAHASGGGTIVYHRFCPPFKIVSLSRAGDGTTLLKTEFPHNLPLDTEENTQVIFFGYSAAGHPANGAVLQAKRVDDDEFSLPAVLWVSDSTTPALCFFVRADTTYFLGLSYMLWKPDRAIEYSSGSLSLQVNTKRAYIPSDLTHDTTYTVTSFDGSATGTDGSDPKQRVIQTGAGFTEAVLGEQLLFYDGGPNVGEWRRITQISTNSVFVDAPFPGNIASGNKFLIGRISASHPAKILQLTRLFNSGTRRVEVYPQKAMVKYFNFP